MPLNLKPVKRGIKVWVLEGSKNGYFSTKLQVCTGKADSREKALGAKDVKELTAHLHWKKRHVFYFTNKQLLVDREKEAFMQRDRQHEDRRGFPDLLKTAKLTNRCVMACACMCKRVGMHDCVCVCVCVGGGGGGGGGRCVCMCVWGEHVCACVWREHVCAYVCTCACVCVCVHVCGGSMCVCTCACVCVCMCVCVCVCVCMCVCVCVIILYHSVWAFLQCTMDDKSHNLRYDIIAEVMRFFLRGTYQRIATLC